MTCTSFYVHLCYCKDKLHLYHVSLLGFPPWRIHRTQGFPTYLHISNLVSADQPSVKCTDYTLSGYWTFLQRICGHGAENKHNTSITTRLFSAEKLIFSKFLYAMAQLQCNVVHMGDYVSAEKCVGAVRSKEAICATKYPHWLKVVFKLNHTWQNFRKTIRGYMGFITILNSYKRGWCTWAG